MAHIQWKDRYNIHFREIDAQHRGLLDLVNELIDLVDSHDPSDQVARIFHSLADYALTHFSSEERYMEAVQYPKLAQQRQEHTFFINRLLELSHAYDPQDPQLVAETLDFLKHWYLEHIIKSDQEYGPFLKRALPTAALEGILLGFAGVICARDMAPLVKLIASHCAKPEVEIQAALEADPCFLQALEAGLSNMDRFALDLATWAGGTLPAEDLAHAYQATFQAVPVMLLLAQRLQAHLPVALVGNGAPWLRAQGLAQLGLAGCCSTEVLSCEVGTCLPDAALFLEAASRLNLAPETCLLIHPDPGCLDSAQAAHFQTLHYTNPVMLMAELRHMGVAF
jgi:hemerythrin